MSSFMLFPICATYCTLGGADKILIAWREQAAKLEAGEITKEDYDRCRYNYPKYDTTQRWAKVP